MSKFVLAAVAVAALGFSGQAFADQLEQRAVSTASVNFTDQAAVKSFYAKLRSAAKEVCDSASVNPVIAQKDRACVEQVMAQAVQKMDRPVLTAMYRANTTGANVGYATGF